MENKKPMCSKLSLWAIESQLAHYNNLVEFYRGKGGNENLAMFFEGRIKLYEYKKEVCLVTKESEGWSNTNTEL